MKQTVIEYPTERLNELREEKKKLTERMNALKLQLSDVENQRLMLTCRIEEIETLFNFAKNDQAAVEDCMARNSIPNKFNDANIAYAYALSILSNMHDTYIVGIDLAEGPDKSPENKDGVAK